MPVLRHAPLQAAGPHDKLTEQREITPSSGFILMKNGETAQGTFRIRAVPRATITILMPERSA